MVIVARHWRGPPGPSQAASTCATRATSSASASPCKHPLGIVPCSSSLLASAWLSPSSPGQEVFSSSITAPLGPCTHLSACGEVAARCALGTPSSRPRSLSATLLLTARNRSVGSELEGREFAIIRSMAALAVPASVYSRMLLAFLFPLRVPTPDETAPSCKPATQRSPPRGTSSDGGATAWSRFPPCPNTSSSDISPSHSMASS